MVTLVVQKVLPSRLEQECEHKFWPQLQHNLCVSDAVKPMF